MININIYRIIQEAMNNCVKHANAAKVSLSIIRTKNALEIIFSDNGIGFNKAILKDTKQFGLVGIEERVKFLKGIFKIDTTLNKGTTLKVKIPLSK